MKNCISKVLILQILCSLFFFPLNVGAQAKIPGCLPTNGVSSSLYVEPQTPNAASLGRYGDCPVSLFTGRPSISIPLYNFKVRNMVLPINLDYDAGGVMVNCLPGWAGQNWTLSAGGVITRNIKGIADEYVFSSMADCLTGQNYFQCPNKLVSLWLNSNDGYQALKQDVKYMQHDLSPDVFTFHFMGKTGKFFLGTDGKWKVLSDDNLEVCFDYTDPSNFISPLFRTFPCSSETQPKAIAGFKIRDEEGNTYFFGYDRNAIEYTINFWEMSIGNYNDSWRASSWYLTKITDRFGNELFKLDYERGAYLIQIFFSHYYYSITSVSDLSNEYIYYSYPERNNQDFPYTISIHSPVYLSVISGAGMTVNIGSSYVPDELATEKLYESFCARYNNFKPSIYDALIQRTSKYPELSVTSSYNQDECYFFYLTSTAADSLRRFRYSPQEDLNIDILGHARMKKLDYVAINGSKPRYYIFNYNYIKRRLCLESISLQDSPSNSSANVVSKYQFYYNNFDQLPADYLTRRIDHWGYYNNVQSIDSIYSTWQGDLQELRAPNLYFCKIGSLSEIEYPTGGSTVFEYELNKYGKYLKDDRQSTISISGNGGGLRIKSIKEYDSHNHLKLLKHREYEYYNWGTNISSGELFATPKYSWSINLPCEQSNTVFNRTIHQSSSIVPLANSFGPSLGYKYVTEIVKDVNNPLNSIKKTVYEFSNLSDLGMLDYRSESLYTNYPSSTPYDEFSELGFKRGRLLSEKVYDTNSDSISITTYEYRTDDIESQFTYTSNLACEFANVAMSEHYIGGVYKLFFPKYDVVKKTEKIRTSNGNYQTAVTMYNKQDYIIGNNNAIVRKCNSMTTTRTSNNNVLESIGEQYTYPMTNINFVTDFYFPQTETASLWNGNITRTHFVYFSNRLFQNGQHMVPCRETEAVGSSAPNTGNGYLGYTVVTYDSYDQTGLLTQYTMKGMAPTHLTWDVYGRLTSEQTEGLHKSYSYKKEGLMVNMTRPNGYTTNYGYDSFGRLAYTRDTLGVLQKYKYNYRTYHFNDAYPDETPDTTNIQDAPNPEIPVIGATCTASVYAYYPQTAEQKTFNIEWPQNVTISVLLTTQRTSTSIMAAINKVSSNGTNINDVYNCTSNNQTIDITYMVYLAPGTYQLSVQTPHYDGDTSTKARISATYQTYE